MAKENAKAAGGDVAPEAPRERIVACAQDLVHRHGIRGVGVETIAEAASTNKMTLYRHFGSKDDLILEYLSRKGRKAEEIWAGIEAASPTILSASFMAISVGLRNSSPRMSAAAILRTPRSN